MKYFKELKELYSKEKCPTTEDILTTYVSNEMDCIHSLKQGEEILCCLLGGELCFLFYDKNKECNSKEKRGE